MDRSRIIQLITLWFVAMLYVKTSVELQGVKEILLTILPLDLLLTGLAIVLVVTIPLYTLSELWTGLHEV